MSKSTVSLVLQQSPLVRDETREEVRRAMADLGYVYNRSAANLLVPSCLTAPGVIPLSTLLASGRERLGSTTVLFTAGALDLLTAEADRILVLERFKAGAIARARRGESRDAILAHYYRGAAVATLGAAGAAE